LTSVREAITQSKQTLINQTEGKSELTKQGLWNAGIQQSCCLQLLTLPLDGVNFCEECFPSFRACLEITISFGEAVNLMAKLTNYSDIFLINALLALSIQPSYAYNLCFYIIMCWT